MRLLIVDDSKAMRGMLSAYAHELQCETVEANDGQVALERLADSGPFDAALLDWDMPVMDGLTCLYAIRKQAEFAGMKVMMVSSQNTYAKVSEALGAGADDFLMKPLDEDMLAEKLRLLGVIE